MSEEKQPSATEPALIDSDFSLRRESVVVHVPRVTPRTIPGLANLQNKGAIDWGGHGLLAYGSNYSVVVIDSRNIQLVQCLDKHKSMVKKVLWGKDYLREDRTTHYPLRLYGNIDLVSSDATGHIIVWDVTSGQQLNILQDNFKTVGDMNWVPQWDNYDHVLMVLYSPSTLVLWDTRTGTKLWKKTYSEHALAFMFDPFHPSKMAFHCIDCILFIEDFSVTKVPPSNGRKFYVSSPKVLSSGAKGSSGNLSGIPQEEKSGPKDRFRRLMKELVIGENKPRTDDMMTLNECLQVAYHRSIRQHILLLYPRELLILDLDINQTVGIIPTMEKCSSPYLQVYSCRQRDVLYCLHESGSVSVKVKKKFGSFGAYSPTDAPLGSLSSLETSFDFQLEVSYDHKCSSEPVRQIRGLQILGIAVNPVSEMHIALYLNSGKIVFMELLPASNAELNFTMNFQTFSTWKSDKCPFQKFSLNQILPPLINEVNIPLPTLRLLVTGILSSVCAPITALKMCPSITTRNWLQYLPLLAVGTIGGLIQVYNVAAACMEKELAVHSHTVRGIEWTGLKTFLSYAFPNISGTASQVKNELCLTDVSTGESIPLRSDKGEESPIEILRVSPLKQYFILALNGGIVELWDLKSKQLMRTMPKKFPVITTFEWSSQSGSKSFKRRQSSKEECILDVKKYDSNRDPCTVEATSMALETPKTSVSKSIVKNVECSDRIMVKEYFVFTDAENQLYRFTVDGHSVDGLRITPESGGGTVTSIAFKADHLVQGDSEGMLSVWDLKTGQTKRHSTLRSCILKMRFAPGKGNMKLLILYHDGADVIDLKAFEKIGQLKCPRDMVKILDLDWAASDKPLLATQDGCLRITDMTLSCSSSPVVDYEFKNPVFCLSLLPSEVAFKMRERLCWQPPDIPYTTNLTIEHGFTENQIALIKVQLSMVEEEKLRCLMKTKFKTAERCLLVAQLFGDEKEIDLWIVVLHYLQISRSKTDATNNLLFKSNEYFSLTGLDCKGFNHSFNIIPLDTCYDVLQDFFTYKRLQLERVALHESRRIDYQHTKRVIRQHLMLGQSDRAVQLLLETDINNSEYYADALKACLVATVQSTETSQSTIKLVATNLIAHGSIWEGVQLLCLIGKGLDACKYLASSSRWEAAAWLARAVLSPNDAVEILKKWADHLFAQGYKEKAVLVLVSLEQWQKAHDLLSVFDPRRASLLAQACQEFGISLLP